MEARSGDSSQQRVENQRVGEDEVEPLEEEVVIVYLVLDVREEVVEVLHQTSYRHPEVVLVPKVLRENRHRMHYLPFLLQSLDPNGRLVEHEPLREFHERVEVPHLDFEDVLEVDSSLLGFLKKHLSSGEGYFLLRLILQTEFLVRTRSLLQHSEGPICFFLVHQASSGP